MPETVCGPITSDGLTGLSNRSSFFAALEGEIQRSARSGCGFCLLMMDLDGFKSVNGQFGHLRGDRMLQRTAEALRVLFPDPDAVCRYGGDEFAVLLPGVDEARAVDLGERVCAAIAAIEVPDWNDAKEPAPAHLTCSVGIAGYPADGSTKEEILTAADRAMYLAKEDGGGRVRTSRQPPS